MKMIGSRWRVLDCWQEDKTSHCFFSSSVLSAWGRLSVFLFGSGRQWACFFSFFFIFSLLVCVPPPSDSHSNTCDIVTSATELQVRDRRDFWLKEKQQNKLKLQTEQTNKDNQPKTEMIISDDPAGVRESKRSFPSSGVWRKKNSGSRGWLHFEIKQILHANVTIYTNAVRRERIVTQCCWKRRSLFG